MKDDLILVTGGGGFIGGSLVADFRKQGYKKIRAVDVKPIDEWYQTFPDVDNRQLDLRQREACDEAAAGAHDIYNLACDMGGMGFIETHKAECMISVLINTHMLRRRAITGSTGAYSSACVRRRQTDAS
jgi:nucleoside-diphosphate-sugar epimerase